MRRDQKIKALLFFFILIGAIGSSSAHSAQSAPAPVAPSVPSPSESASAQVNEIKSGTAGTSSTAPTPPATTGAPPFITNPATTLTPLTLNTPSSDPDYDIYLKSKFANPRWDSLVREGFDNFAQGQGLQTIDFLQKAIGQGCVSPLLYFKLAATYEFLGNVYTALQYYALVEKDFDSLPPNHEYRSIFNESYARALLTNNQPQEALPYLEKAAPTTTEYWVLARLGDYYISQNNLNAALPHLLRAVEVPSVRTIDAVEIAHVYLTIAKIYNSQQNKDETYRYLDYAVQTDPNNQEAAGLKQQLIQQKQQEAQMKNMDQMMQWFQSK